MDYFNPIRKKISYKSNRDKNIYFSSQLEDTIINIVSIHNKNYPNKKIKLDIAKQIVKRGIDSCLNNLKTSNERSELGLLRLRNFLSKMLGKVNDRYILDNDLLKKNKT